MNTKIKYVLIGTATVFFGTGIAASAQAYYLGYANGDPANWGFYEEQHNGASQPEPLAEPHVYSHVSRHPGQIRYHGRLYLRERHMPSEY